MFVIEIFTKDGYRDSRGEHISSDINSIISKSVKKVRYCSLYIIEGNLLLKEIKRIASCLLSDAITENYIITTCDNKDSQHCFNGVSISKAMIEVLYKKGVTDTVSSSVVKAVRDLGVDKEIKVKTGSRYYLTGDLSKDILNNIACNLLANTLVQEYKIKSIE
jgi:phosphoribosylformylglycinamidine synthase